MIASSSSFAVRAATTADIAVLVEFNAAMARETENKTLDPAILQPGVAAVLAQPQRGFYLIAEQGAQVAGCLMVTFEWSDWRNGDWWWLQSVYVRPGFRRAGVFRALYHEIERRAVATPGVVGVRLYVEQENERAQQTYVTLGLTPAHYRMYEKSLP
jgi:ribosomal protein S18 acetylase RimI-like enzyme